MLSTCSSDKMKYVLNAFGAEAAVMTKNQSLSSRNEQLVEKTDKQ